MFMHRHGDNIHSIIWKGRPTHSVFKQCGYSSQYTELKAEPFRDLSCTERLGFYSSLTVPAAIIN